MRVRPRTRWVMSPPVDETVINHLTSELRLPHDITRLLALRGYTTAEEAKLFLRPRLEHLHDSERMGGLNVAVERLARAVAKGETILVHGDYDVDGICSTTLLVRTIRGLGGTVIPFIPHRLTDGYDLGPAGVRAAIEAKATVVVTCDCGTSAIQPIADLNAAGIDVIVSDHHLPGGALPETLAVLNPRRPGCEYPDKDLAAVGVAFKLSLALAKALGKPDAFIWKMLDLVALATVADIAPLRGENRVFVRYGLRMMSETENIGLRALIRSSGLDGKPLTAGRVGYILAPRLNAVGRLDSALRGVQLLLSENPHEANAIARELEELNRKRQEIDRATLDEARAMVQAMPLDETYGIALASPSWHPGVIGIVASRIVEEFGRPTMLIGLDGETGKGSGRSIAAFDLHSALQACSDLLLRFGGHKAAAGITIHASQVANFAERFNEVARERLTQDDLVPELRVDAELNLDHATDELETILRHFEPFGVGNPSPVFAARNVTLAAPPRVVGRDALKLKLSTPHGPLEAIGWGMGNYADTLTPNTTFDIAFRLERDEYLGSNRLQAKLADIVVHQPSLV
jgi:single-stranded-DNA-specific exonuclease